MPMGWNACSQPFSRSAQRRAGVPPAVEGEHPAARTWARPFQGPWDDSRAFRRARRMNNILDEPLRG
jgi:hypothetical protein